MVNKHFLGGQKESEKTQEAYDQKVMKTYEKFDPCP